jgi:hypothetical protein
MPTLADLFFRLQVFDIALVIGFVMWDFEALRLDIGVCWSFLR